MRRVILESPYAGAVNGNIAYARLCLKDCLNKEDAPFASHLLYTQPTVLDDANSIERATGMDACLAWLDVAEAVVVYTDRGITSGMKFGIEQAEKRGVPIEFRRLYNPEKPDPKQLFLFGDFV